MKYVLMCVIFIAQLLVPKNIIIRCSTPDDVLNALLKVAQGMEIVLEDGEYQFSTPILLQINGTQSEPVIIKSKNRNMAVITGNTMMRLRNSSYVTIEGLKFNNNGSQAIRLEGCNNVRITRNMFKLEEDGRGSWVMITGNSKDTLMLSHHNMVDRNLFEEKSDLGNFVTIEGTKKFSSAVSQYDVVEWNHFRNIGPRAENVLEAVRIGSSEYTLSRGYTILQNNLFEHCNGDPEYISIKQSDCTVRGNTFIECFGSLSLRHGNRSRVEYNVIIGNNKTGTFLDSTGKNWVLGAGGIRFCGDSMTIRGNYCEGLTGTEWDGTIAATNGDADYGEGKSLTKHYRTTNALLVDNILVNNKSGIEIGFDGAGFQGNWWNKPPKMLTVRNNVITGNNDTLVKFFNKPIDATFENNIVFPTGTAVASTEPVSGIDIKDPDLVRVKGLLMPKKESLLMQNLKRLTANDVGPNAP